MLFVTPSADGFRPYLDLCPRSAASVNLSRFLDSQFSPKKSFLVKGSGQRRHLSGRLVSYAGAPDTFLQAAQTAGKRVGVAKQREDAEQAHPVTASPEEPRSSILISTSPGDRPMRLPGHGLSAVRQQRFQRFQGSICTRKAAIDTANQCRSRRIGEAVAAAGHAVYLPQQRLSSPKFAIRAARVAGVDGRSVGRRAPGDSPNWGRARPQPPVAQTWNY